MRRCVTQLRTRAKIALTVLGLAVLVAACTTDAPPAPSPTSATSGDRLLDCPGTTQIEINRCRERQAELAVDRLEALLQELTATLDRSASAQLAVAQRDWLAYRTAHCEWQAARYEGGSVRPGIYSLCVKDVTWSRIAELKLNLCDGNGATGPCTASRRYDEPPAGRR